MKFMAKFARRWMMPLGVAFFALALAALPALAQEGASPDATETPMGVFDRWLDFLLVVGGLAYFSKTVFGPYFRKRAGAISGNIREAAEERTRAQQELAEAEQQLAGVAAEVEEMRRAAARSSAEECERIQALARLEAERVARAAQAEIEAAERAGQQELQAIAARLATERAAALLRQQMNAQAQAMIFRSFLNQLPRSAS